MEASQTLQEETLSNFSAIFGAANIESMAVGPTVIYAFFYFKKPLDRSKVERSFNDRWMEIRRFRSRPTRVGNNYKFVEMAKEDIPLNKMIIEVPNINTAADISEFVSEKNKQPMGTDLPMWRAHIFNSMDDGRSCLCLAWDHMIADGVGLIGILFSVLFDHDEAIESRKPPATGSNMKKKAGPGCFAMMGACCGACFNVSIGDQLPADTRTRLKVKDHRKMKGTGKSLAKSHSIDVARLKQAKDLFPGCTVNDVLMVVLCMCLRMYYEKYEPTALRGGCCGPSKIRGNFPINLRGIDNKYKNTGLADNAFSQGQLRFPIHLADPVDMMRNIKAQTEKVKSSPEPIMRDRTLGWLAKTVLPRFPTLTANLVLDQFGKVTAMLSNVMGPTNQVSFLGQPIDDMDFYVLVPIGLYFGLMTYNGHCTASVCMDNTTEESEANNLAELFPAAFERVCNAANVSNQ